MRQVEENLISASRSGVGSFGPAQTRLMEEARAAWKGVAPVACTHCEYCLPCPNEVLIPQIFEIYNNSVMYDLQARGKRRYEREIAAENRADQCVECGTCESLCPQHLEIIQYLKDAHAYLREA